MTRLAAVVLCSLIVGTSSLGLAEKYSTREDFVGTLQPFPEEHEFMFTMAKAVMQGAISASVNATIIMNVEPSIGETVLKIKGRLEMVDGDGRLDMVIEGSDEPVKLVADFVGGSVMLTPPTGTVGDLPLADPLGLYDALSKDRVAPAGIDDAGAFVIDMALLDPGAVEAGDAGQGASALIWFDPADMVILRAYVFNGTGRLVRVYDKFDFTNWPNLDSFRVTSRTGGGTTTFKLDQLMFD